MSDVILKAKEFTEKSIDKLIPKNRIKGYDEARTEYTRAVSAHIGQSIIWSKIDKLFTGVPPFNPEILKKLNQKHVVNTDFGDARARLQKGITSYYNIFYKNKYLAEINVIACEELVSKFTADQVSSLDSYSLKDWSNIITEEWTYNKRKVWGKEFFTFISSHLRQLMMYGLNHIYFPHKEDPRPKCGTRYAHYNTQDASILPEENDVHIVKHEYSIYELLGFYSNDKTGYWNKKAIAEIVHQIMTAEDKAPDLSDQVSYVEKTIENLRQHTGINSEFYNTKVEVASFFVKEMEFENEKSGISHIIITPHIKTESELFFHDRAYKNIGDALIISTLLPGFEKIKDAKGLGHISYGHLLELTKMKCNFATNIKLSGTTFFRSETNSVSDIKKVTVPVSGISILPDNIKLEHANTNLAAQNIMAGVQYLESDLDKNSLFLMSAIGSDNQPVGQIQARAKESAEMQQNNIAHYTTTTLDILFQTIFRKELEFNTKKNLGAKYAKNFIERCVKRGVPIEIFTFTDVDDITGLPKWFTLNAYSSGATGSQISDLLKIQESYQLSIPQRLKSRGRRYFNELEISALWGQEMVPKLLPPEDVADDPTYMAVMASTVANQLAKGEIVVFSPDLDHEVFATTLIERMQQIADTYLSQPATGIESEKQKERDRLFETDLAMQALGNYAGLHLTYLAEDPSGRELFNSLLPLFTRLEGFSQGIHANANKARDAQSREASEMAGENNIALQKLLFDHERKLLGVKLEHIRKTFSTTGSFKLGIIQANNKGAVDRIKALGKIKADIDKQRPQSAIAS